MATFFTLTKDQIKNGTRPKVVRRRKQLEDIERKTLEMKKQEDALKKYNNVIPIRPVQKSSKKLYWLIAACIIAEHIILLHYWIK